MPTTTNNILVAKLYYLNMGNEWELTNTMETKHLHKGMHTTIAKWRASGLRVTLEDGDGNPVPS